MTEKKFKLKRTKQCAKCPWKVSTNPHDIPRYCPKGHAVAVKKTIADKDSPMESYYKPTPAMACHHSDGNDKMYCVGWLHNQIGVGNNIGLRMRMLNCENVRELKTVGKQHETFEETLPK